MHLRVRGDPCRNSRLCTSPASSFHLGRDIESCQPKPWSPSNKHNGMEDSSGSRCLHLPYTDCAYRTAAHGQTVNARLRTLPTVDLCSRISRSANGVSSSREYNTTLMSHADKTDRTFSRTPDPIFMNSNGSGDLRRHKSFGLYMMEDCPAVPPVYKGGIHE